MIEWTDRRKQDQMRVQRLVWKEVCSLAMQRCSSQEPGECLWGATFEKSTGTGCLWIAGRWLRDHKTTLEALNCFKGLHFPLHECANMTWVESNAACKVKSWFSICFCFYTMSTLYCLKILMVSWFFFNLPLGWDLSCGFRVPWKNTGFYWGTWFNPIKIQEYYIPSLLKVSVGLFQFLCICVTSLAQLPRSWKVFARVLEMESCFRRWVQWPKVKCKHWDIFIRFRWHIQMLQKTLLFGFLTSVFVYFWLQWQFEVISV